MIALRAPRRLAAILALGLLVAACGNSATDDDASVDVDAMTSRPVTADEVVAEAEPDRLPLDEAQASEAPDPQGPIGVFTGLPIDPELAGRPALVVKIDNHPRARPQTGLDLADIVFDYRAEGVTRFAAVFQSQTPEPVGPVRSSRTSDFDLLRGFDNPLYASSGANDIVADGLRSLPIVELTNRTRNEYFRDFSRPAPHNLYVNAGDLYALAPDDLPTPQPWFRYRAPDEALPASATPAIGPVRIAYTGSPLVTHQWDEVVGGWLRTQDGAPHLTVAGDQLAPENVVIMVTDYAVSPADPISPEVISTGGGPLFVLTDGHIIAGRWERPRAEDKPTLTDVDGEVISLTPGRTWVLMPEEGQVTFAPGQQIDDGAAGSSTGTP